jgi:tetratricopeptide (TPR) repeat protein
MASGDVLNTASRLQAAAPTNAILVDARTYRATRQMIDYGEATPIEAKGKAAPIAVWKALHSRSRFGVDLVEHGRTPLVGRERELNVLTEALARAREERSPQLVTLVGVPGIGKSRLVYELMQTVADDPSGMVTWRQGRSLSYGDGVSFWALAEIVKAQAGILERETDAEAGEKLVRAVQALLDDDSEARWVERHLRRLVGLGGEATIPAERSEAFAAWRRFFEMLADRRPAVLVFEDLHWADEGLLDFVDSLVDAVADVPLLIVATARPELLGRRRAWGGGKANATTLSLSPLSGPETLQLVRALAERQQLSPTPEEALVEHAAGNALYTEQYVRVWEERGDADQLPLPESVQGLIAARLDDLPAAEKSVLQNAAVLGKVFWPGAVVAVDGIDRATAAESLGALERKQFVQRARRSTVADESEYAFRHVLVRDVAYGQIPRMRRARKHERAAAWIESLGRIDDHAETLAYHYLSAFDLLGVAGEDTSQILRRARVALGQAADRAFALHAYAAAGRYYEKAIGLVAEDDAERPELLLRFGRALINAGDERGEEALERARDALIAAGKGARAAEACILLAEHWWLRGQRARANSQLEQARELITTEAASPSKAWVLANISRYLTLAGESATGLRLGREARAMAETLGLDDVRAHTLNNIGIARCYLGDFGGIADLERSIEIASAIDSPSELARAYNNLATVFGELQGNLRRDLELRREAVRVAQRAGNERLARYSGAILIFAEYFGGNWDGFVTKAHQYLEESERLGGGYQDAFFYATLAHIAVARGEDANALAGAQRAVQLSQEAGDPQVVLPVLSHAATINIALGNVEIARGFARRLVDVSFERLSAGASLGNFPSILFSPWPRASWASTAS